MQLHFSVTFACCGNVEILVSTWYEEEVVQILKMILGKNYWCADSPGLQVCKSVSLQVCKSASLQVCKSASLQVCRSASLQVCSLQVLHTGLSPQCLWASQFNFFSQWNANQSYSLRTAYLIFEARFKFFFQQFPCVLQLWRFIIKWKKERMKHKALHR